LLMPLCELATTTISSLYTMTGMSIRQGSRKAGSVIFISCE
jgi:hypothetical protein